MEHFVWEGVHTPTVGHILWVLRQAADRYVLTIH